MSENTREIATDPGQPASQAPQRLPWIAPRLESLDIGDHTHLGAFSLSNDGNFSSS